MSADLHPRFAVVRNIVAEASALSAEDITPETRLDALGMDSLEFIEMMIQVQGSCDVEIPDEQIARLNTVEDICKAVEMCQV